MSGKPQSDSQAARREQAGYRLSFLSSLGSLQRNAIPLDRNAPLALHLGEHEKVRRAPLTVGFPDGLGVPRRFHNPPSTGDSTSCASSTSLAADSPAQGSTDWVSRRFDGTAGKERWHFGEKRRVQFRPRVHAPHGHSPPTAIRSAMPLEAARAVSISSGAQRCASWSRVQRLVVPAMLIAATGRPWGPMTAAPIVRSPR